MSDVVVVRINGLEVFGRHGVLPAETALGQRFVVDVAATLNDCPGAYDDDLAGTLDYAALTGRVADVVAGEPVRLLEHLAHRIADLVLGEPRVASVEVTVRKPHVALPFVVRETAVTLHRRQE